MQNALDNSSPAQADRRQPPTEPVAVAVAAAEISGPPSDSEPQAAAKRKPSNGVAAGGPQPAPFIDRHVLTEHEVVPNLELNPNKPWTSRFSRSLKSSIAYRFR